MGTPEEVYEAPKTAFVAEFLGASNKIGGRVERGHFIVENIALPFNGSGLPDGDAIALARPQECAFSNGNEPGIPATVTDVLAAGINVRVACRRPNGEPLEVALPPGSRTPGVAENIHVKLLTPRIHPSTAF